MHTRVANYGMRKSFSFSKFQNSERNIPILPAKCMFPSGEDFKNSKPQSKSNVRRPNERTTDTLKTATSMMVTDFVDDKFEIFVTDF